MCLRHFIGGTSGRPTTPTKPDHTNNNRTAQSTVYTGFRPFWKSHFFDPLTEKAPPHYFYVCSRWPDLVTGPFSSFGSPYAAALQNFIFRKELIAAYWEFISASGHHKRMNTRNKRCSRGESSSNLPTHQIPAMGRDR
jgi:hypothetical protein